MTMANDTIVMVADIPKMLQWHLRSTQLSNHTHQFLVVEDNIAVTTGSAGQSFIDVRNNHS